MRKILTFTILLLSWTSFFAPLVTPKIIPGNASWITDEFKGDGTHPYESFLPIVYTLLGNEGEAIVRAIIDKDTDCPKELIYSGKNLDFHSPKFVTRAKGDHGLPYAFPIRICDARIPSSNADAKAAIFDGTLTFSAKHALPLLMGEPTRFLIMGDTGLRSKSQSLGLGKCSDSELYGVHQCAEDFTETDLSEGIADVLYLQNLTHWPFKNLSKAALTLEPDVYVHVGDFMYRQAPCPASNNQNVECSAINLPEHFDISHLPDGVVMDFLPGNWGDNWFGWWADFFYPALDILRTTPLIALRGNHENCDRSGHGWFLLLSTEEYPSDTVAGNYCKKVSDPFYVPFKNEQFLVMDDNYIEEYKGGIDHFMFVDGACPQPSGPNEPPIVPIQQNRYLDTSVPTEEIEDDIATFSSYFEKMSNFSLSHSTNFYLGHRPVLGVACNDTTMVTLDWTLQQSLGCSTLDRISAMIGGHMHWSEVLTFVNNSLPVQITVGNSGTKLIPNYVDHATLKGLKLEIGRADLGIEGVIERGRISSNFGFSYLVKTDGGYNINFYEYEVGANSLNKVNDFPLMIKDGIRPKAEKACVPKKSLPSFHHKMIGDFLVILILLVAYFVAQRNFVYSRRHNYELLDEIEME